MSKKITKKINISEDQLNTIIAELFADFIVGLREKIGLKNLENKIMENDLWQKE